MKGNQLVPLLAKLGLFGLAVWAIGSLFSDDGAEQKPDPAPTGGIPRNFAEISVNPQVSTPPVPKIPLPAATAPAAKIAAQTPPPPVNRRHVTREDMASIFQRGTRAMTRTEVVVVLKTLGFGHTAAYEAVSANGRFASWLQFAPDGIIKWKG